MSDHVIEDIKSRLDIADVIREYIPLSQAGSNLKAVCPFHREKTASFMVSLSKQIWYCFGCNEGGDMFKFVMKQEGFEFNEALRLLAQKAGVTLEHHDPRAATQRGRITGLLTLASQYFHQAFSRSLSAEKARSYATKRKLEQSTIDEFKIGYALPEFEALYPFLISRKYTPQEIERAGLCIKKERGYGCYDRFRDRLMIPIRDIHGQVVGFGGRILEQRDDSAKYLNSPQTESYDKSRIVFGLDKAKQAIRDAGFVIVVEGYMDFFAIYQYGMKNVVAISGTALTVEQINLIKRFTQTMYFSFDMDTAGVQATRRGIDLALSGGMNVKIIQLPRRQDGSPKYKDPDECISACPNEWEEAISRALSFAAFSYDRLFHFSRDADAFQRNKAVREFLGILYLFSDRIEQDTWIRTVSREHGISEALLWEELKRSGGKKNISIAKEENSQKQPYVASVEDILLASLLKDPQQFSFAKEVLTEDMFESQENSLLYRVALEGYSSHACEDREKLEKYLLQYYRNENHGAKLMFLADERESATQLSPLNIRQFAEKLRNAYKKKCIQNLQYNMSEAERCGDETAIRKHLEEFRKITES